MTPLVILVDYPISPFWLRYLSLSDLSDAFRVTFVEIKITERQRQAFSRARFMERIENRVEVFGTGEMLALAGRLDRAIVIDLLASRLARYVLLNRSLRRRGCKFVKVLIGTVPDYATGTPFAKRLARAVSGPDLINRFARLFMSRLAKRAMRLMTYDYSVLGGLAAEAALPPRHGRIIPTCGFDYWEYSRVGDTPSADERYALLIEENFSNNSDGALVGYSHVPEPRAYFRSLAAFLKAFETVTGLPVRVLPHPKTDRAWLKEHLPDFAQVSGSSAAAIRGSEAVLTHMSTAVGLAVLARRPIVLVNCAGLSAEVHGRMAAMARSLGLRPYSVEDLSALANGGLGILIPSDERRTTYIDHYVRHPSAKASSFREVLGEIRDSSE